MRPREDLNTRLLETVTTLRRGLVRRVIGAFPVAFDAFGTGIRELGAPGDALRLVFRVDAMLYERCRSLRRDALKEWMKKGRAKAKGNKT